MNEHDESISIRSIHITFMNLYIVRSPTGPLVGGAAVSGGYSAGNKQYDWTLLANKSCYYRRSFKFLLNGF